MITAYRSLGLVWVRLILKHCIVWCCKIHERRKNKKNKNAMQKPDGEIVSETVLKDVLGQPKCWDSTFCTLCIVSQLCIDWICSHIVLFCTFVQSSLRNVLFCEIRVHSLISTLHHFRNHYKTQLHCFPDRSNRWLFTPLSSSFLPLSLSCLWTGAERCCEAADQVTWCRSRLNYYSYWFMIDFNSCSQSGPCLYFWPTLSLCDRLATETLWPGPAQLSLCAKEFVLVVKHFVALLN